MKAAWEAKAVGDVCSIVGGGTPPRSNAAFYGGKIPWATIRDMKADWIETTEFSITPAAVKSSATNLLPAGTVIVASRVGLGKVCRLRRDTAINQDLRGFIPKSAKQLDSQYLFLWFKSVADQIVAAGTGATVQGVTLPFLRSLQIPLPSLEEQRRIVALLDEAFTAIATATANAEKNLANARELFEVQRDRMLQTSAEGWQESVLSSLCTIKHGFAFKSKYFCNKAAYTLLTPGNFFEAGGYRDRGPKQKYYDGPVPNGFVLNGGDLLVAMTEQAAGLLGSPILVPTASFYLHNQRLGLVQPRPGVEWVNGFFFHVFNSSHLRDQLHRTGTGQKVRHTSPGKIGDVVVRYPATAAEQSVVASQLDDLWSQTEQLHDTYSERLEKLTSLKQSLLHRAFAGELKSKAVAVVALNDNFATPEFSAKVVAFAYERHVAKNRVRNFGTVKAEKILHMVEAIGGIDLGRQPLREAAGPDDAKHRHATWEWARSQNFFRFNKRNGGGHNFEKLSSYPGLIKDAGMDIAGSAVEKAIELLVDMDRDFAELIATTYAAWNNLIIDQCAATDGDIVLAARDKWHRDKLRFDPSRFHDAIRFIRNNSIVPDGTAKRVGGQEALLL